MRFTAFYFTTTARMHLMYYLGEDGKRVYTLKVRRTVDACVCPIMPLCGMLVAQKTTADGSPTVSAHPGEAYHCRLDCMLL